jgi:small-conductance mechanosensitive channel
MPVDQSLVGRAFPPTAPLEVTEERVAAFAASLGAPYDPSGAARAVPPTYPIVLAFDAMQAFLASEQIDLFRIVHGEQRFAYERPVRVGDVITIGDLSGRVTRIRTRATTILDFDNKEIVVPNKLFITDQLINWTLSDTTTRITIKLGVAYGSDPTAVHAVLRDAARENPRVLTDPEPATWFLAFGASSLDFELRVFVANLSDRLAVQDEINGRVATLCAERGIEIAFPQLDVRVRDLPAARDT